MSVFPVNHVLILCHAFPPYPGIGGRRWVKFAKHLSLSGIEVSVISSEPPGNTYSLWKNETKLKNHIILPLKYPKALILFPKSIIGKIGYRIGIARVKLFSKGNYYDRTIFWRSQLIDAYKQLIQKEKISHVVVSGAPFSWFNFVNDLKQLDNKVKFIADIRDPWTDNESAYGYTSLSKKRLDFEKNAELEMLKNFDQIITVNEHIADYFRKRNSKNADHIYTLPNGFDEEEMDTDFPEDLKWDQTKINLVFTGSFYQDARYLFELFISGLDQLYKQLPDFPFRIYFFGPNVEILKSAIPAHLSGFFTFGYYNNLQNVNAVISKANYALLFLTDDINNSLSTKFCEYIKFKKKILVFSKPGFTGNYVSENKIGYFLGKESITTILEKINVTKQPEEFPGSFDVKQFSITKITEDLIHILEN